MPRRRRRRTRSRHQIEELLEVATVSAVEHEEDADLLRDLLEPDDLHEVAAWLGRCERAPGTQVTLDLGDVTLVRLPASDAVELDVDGALTVRVTTAEVAGVLDEIRAGGRLAP